MNTDVSSSATRSSGWRRPASMLAIGSFAVGTDAFVIAGILPSMADSLAVSVGVAGQLVSAFALAYGLSAPLVGALTATWGRRTALLAALAVFVVGNAATAFAPTYWAVLAARVLSAVGAALYTATATSTAATIAGDERRGRAISIVMLGMTSSLVLGAPLGTVLGGALGWRATLWLVAGLGVLAVAAVVLGVPAVPGSVSAGVARRLRPLAQPAILGVLARTVVAFVGIYLPYTYLSVVYQEATGEVPAKLSLLLLVFGLSATAGNLVAGMLVDRFGPHRVVIAACLSMTVLFALLPLVGGSFGLALVAVVLSGWLSFSVTTPQQHEIIARALPEDRAFVTSLYQSAAYLAISLSAVVGAVGISAVGHAVVGPLAAALVLVAALLTLWTVRARHESYS
ncbi:MFS transporter [Pseudonocardia spinosispora]|uniref:MFS transporter n=1 Tax=Pseudonocardia spinosispora TaxID=103441 RepID=UPI0003F88F2A|nr:MFS transporter [Pseudonocardia spinosispora]